MSRLEHTLTLNALKSRLLSEGYQYICAVMDDCGTGGLHFSKIPLTDEEYLYEPRPQAWIRNSEIFYTIKPPIEVRK